MGIPYGPGPRTDPGPKWALVHISKTLLDFKDFLGCSLMCIICLWFPLILQDFPVPGPGPVGLRPIWARVPYGVAPECIFIYVYLSDFVYGVCVFAILGVWGSAFILLRPSFAILSTKHDASIKINKNQFHKIKSIITFIFVITFIFLALPFIDTLLIQPWIVLLQLCQSLFLHSRSQINTVILCTTLGPFMIFS